MKYEELLDVLIKKNLTISSIESLTGGLFASTITSISGASKVYKGSLVTYTNEIKEKVGVKEETLNKYGAISSNCALEMAINSKEFFRSDISVSFTGNAGPTSSEGKEVGLVFICILIKDNNPINIKLNLTGSRNEIRQKCVDYVFNELISLLK